MPSKHFKNCHINAFLYGLKARKIALVNEASHRSFRYANSGSILLTSLLVTGLVSYHHQAEYQQQTPTQLETLRQEILAQNEQQGSNSRGDGRREEEQGKDKKQEHRIELKG